MRSGLTYTILREGLYAEGIPLFLSYRPESTEVVLPGDGPVTFVPIAELAEATARVVHAPSAKFANMMLLFSGSSVSTLAEIAGMIGKARGKELPVHIVSRDEYVERITKGANERLALFADTLAGVANGDCATVSPELEELLGREPTSIEEVVRSTFAGDSAKSI
jgi:hypothetical protein